MSDSPKAKKQQDDLGQTTMPLTTAEMLAAEESQDRKFARWALGIAIVFHIAIFAIQWPSFAGGLSDAKEKKNKIYVVKQVKFKQPPKQELQQIRRQLEQIRLQADVVIPADMERQARELIAKGEAAPIEEQGLGWKSSFGSGKGGHTISSGIEGAWKPNPTKWDMGYLKVLFKYEWELVKSPAGANQWLAKDVAEEDMVVDAHDPAKKHRPMMTTADLSLRFDPIYEPIARRYLENPEEFADAFARAWFKLTHRDMGPRTRYLGPEVPAEELIWQDPVPKVNHKLVSKRDVAALKKKILASGLSVSDLVFTAWAAASVAGGPSTFGAARGSCSAAISSASFISSCATMAEKGNAAWLLGSVIRRLPRLDVVSPGSPGSVGGGGGGSASCACRSIPDRCRRAAARTDGNEHSV